MMAWDEQDTVDQEVGLQREHDFDHHQDAPVEGCPACPPIEEDDQ